MYLKLCAGNYSPDAVEHRLFLGGRFGDGPLGAHYLALVLLFSCFAVFVLIGLGSAILPQNLIQTNYFDTRECTYSIQC